MKKSVKKVRKTKKKDSLSFQLDGKVFIIETTKGKTTKTELEGKVVLECLVAILHQALEEKLDYPL